MESTPGFSTSAPELRRALQMPWVESPYLKAELGESNVREDVAKLALHYHEHGYAIFDPEVPDFETLSSGIKDRLAPRYDATGRLTNAWEYDPAVRNLALAPKVLSLLPLLYGRKPIPYQTLNFNVGTEQRTHSDSVHFASVPARFMCGVWIALEDIDADNGPLHYYPGSHRLPILSLEDMGIDKAIRHPGERYRVYEEFLQSYIEAMGLQREEISLKKGQAMIWSANLLHGGSPIKQRGRSRHSQVTHYFFEDCQYYSPMQSTIFRGEIQFIHFRNILTGQKVSQEKPPWVNLHRLTSRYRVRQALDFLRHLTGSRGRSS